MNNEITIEQYLKNIKNKIRMSETDIYSLLYSHLRKEANNIVKSDSNFDISEFEIDLNNIIVDLINEIEVEIEIND